MTYIPDVYVVGTVCLEGQYIQKGFYLHVLLGGPLTYVCEVIQKCVRFCMWTQTFVFGLAYKHNYVHRVERICCTAFTVNMVCHLLFTIIISLEVTQK